MAYVKIEKSISSRIDYTGLNDRNLYLYSQDKTTYKYAELSLNWNNQTKYITKNIIRWIIMLILVLIFIVMFDIYKPKNMDSHDCTQYGRFIYFSVHAVPFLITGIYIMLMINIVIMRLRYNNVGETWNSIIIVSIWLYIYNISCGLFCHYAMFIVYYINEYETPDKTDKQYRQSRLCVRNAGNIFGIHIVNITAMYVFM